LAGYVALFTLNSIAMHGPSPWSFLSLVLWQCGITLSPLLSPLNQSSKSPAKTFSGRAAVTAFSGL
jgi:hypothetical protein